MRLARLDTNERAERTAALLRARRAIGAASRPRARVPRQVPPTAIEREYARELLAIVEVTRGALQPVLAALPALLERAKVDRERMDTGEGREAQRLIEQTQERLRAALRTEEIERLPARFAARTSQHQREQLARQVRAALGIDVFMADRSIGAMLDGFVAENVALIKSIPAEIVSKTERAVTRGIQAGTLVRDLTAEIDDIVDGGKKRARLIARDQVGKLNGQINEARQKEMGVDRYTWRTVNDQRVRDEHAERNGEAFRWDSPPDDGHPGQPVQCRCYAEPDFSALLDAV
jgi:SPP1 gp7 family putative phage head morphogenesis protein